MSFYVVKFHARSIEIDHLTLTTTLDGVTLTLEGGGIEEESNTHQLVGYKFTGFWLQILSVSFMSSFTMAAKSEMIWRCVLCTTL